MKFVPNFYQVIIYGEEHQAGQSFTSKQRLNSDFTEHNKLYQCQEKSICITFDKAEYSLSSFNWLIPFVLHCLISAFAWHYMIYFSFDKCRSLMNYICFNYIMLQVLYLRHCVLNNVEKRFQQVESNPVPMDSTSYALIITLRAHFSIYNFFYNNKSRIYIL